MEDLLETCFDCGVERAYFDRRQGFEEMRRYGPYPSVVLAWTCGLCGG